MTLSERLGVEAPVSLAGLAYGDRVTGIRSRLSYAQLAEHAVRGGWPELLDADTDAGDQLQHQLPALPRPHRPEDARAHPAPARPDHRPAHQPRPPHRRATSASPASATTRTAGLGRDTVRSYLDALDRLHAWEPQPAWQPPLRTRARLRHRPRAHLADPALACAALGYDADRLADDPDQFAAIFTAMVIHDLRVYLEGTGAQLYHYKDETGLAIDAIIQYPDGRWAALQTSLGDHHAIDAEIALETLRDDRLDLDQVGQPRYLAVITGGTHATTTRTRTHTIPLATLTA